MISDPKVFYFYPDDIPLASIFRESMHPAFFPFYPQKLSCNSLCILSGKSEIKKKKVQKRKKINDFVK